MNNITAHVEYDVGQVLATRSGEKARVTAIVYSGYDWLYKMEYLVPGDCDEPFCTTVAYVEQYYTVPTVTDLEAANSLTREELVNIAVDVAATAYGDGGVTLTHTFDIDDDHEVRQPPEWASLAPLRDALGR